MPLTYEQHLQRDRVLAPMPKVLVVHANPATEPFEMGDVGACPDHVRNYYPVPAQEAFRKTFNTNLHFTGSPEYAMRAGMAAAKQMARTLKQRAAKRAKTDDSSTIMQEIDDLYKPRRTGVLVPVDIA